MVVKMVLNLSILVSSRANLTMMVEHVGIEPTRPRSCKDQALTLSVPHRHREKASNLQSLLGQSQAGLPVPLSRYGNYYSNTVAITILF